MLSFPKRFLPSCEQGLCLSCYLTLKVITCLTQLPWTGFWILGGGIPRYIKDLLLGHTYWTISLVLLNKFLFCFPEQELTEQLLCTRSHAAGPRADIKQNTQGLLNGEHLEEMRWRKGRVETNSSTLSLYPGSLWSICSLDQKLPELRACSRNVLAFPY